MNQIGGSPLEGARPRFPLLLASLLGAALLMNYVDRGTISIAGTLI